jgi:hypothetical protein
MVAANASLANKTWCPTLATDVGPDHRCAACTLQGDLRRANDDISQLRRALAEANAALTRASVALIGEREAHALTSRKLQNVTGQRDFISEAFDAARESIAILEAKRDGSPDAFRMAGAL